MFVVPPILRYLAGRLKKQRSDLKRNVLILRTPNSRNMIPTNGKVKRDPSRIKIAIVSPYPESHLGLSEYTAEIVQPLSRLNGFHRDITVLADIAPGQTPSVQTVGGIRVDRCWRYNDWRNLFVIFRRIMAIRPDVIWFDFIFSTFGDRRVPAFLGLLLPLLCRLRGFRTVVTLHHLYDLMDPHFSRLHSYSFIERKALDLATRAILQSNEVVLPLQRYVTHLADRYGATNVRRIPHGFFFSPRGRSTGERRHVLVFGKFGSYKRLDFAIDAFSRLKRDCPNLKLVIAGRSHPSFPGYVEDFARRYGGDPSIVFKGYIPFSELPQVFEASYLLFLPYQAVGGASGVSLLGCSFGLPIVAPDLPEIENVCQEDDVSMLTYSSEDAADAARKMRAVLCEPQLAENLGERNRRAASRHPTSSVAVAYDELFRSIAR